MLRFPTLPLLPLLPLFASMVASVILTSPLQAAMVQSDPIGSITVTLKGGSDTRFAIPMMRRSVYTGEIKSVDAVNNSIELKGASWANGRFVFEDANNPDPNATYFVVVTSGTQNGAKYKIESNGANTLVVDPGLNLLTGLSSADVDGAGDTVKVYPYPTLASVFSKTSVPDGTRVYEYDNSRSIINKGPDAVYTYFLSFDAWIDGDSGSNVGHTALLQVDKGYVIRISEGNPDIQLFIPGEVGMFNDRKVFTNDADSSNDIIFALSSPTPVAIGNTNLNIQDGVRVYAYDNTSIGFNKAPSTVLTYFLDFDSWIDGDTGNTVDNTYFLEPGMAYVIRKPKSTAAEVVETSFIPPYLAL